MKHAFATLLFLAGAALVRSEPAQAEPAQTEPSQTEQPGATASEEGKRVAQESSKRNDGFKDSQAELEMLMKTPGSKDVKRRMRVLTYEVAGDGEKSLTIFQEPMDVKGTSFLVHSHADGNDDQWLYLPELKRVKRINAKNQNGKFMGSEFAFEDLSSQEMAKFTYLLVGQDSGHYLVEQVPVNKASGYGKMRVRYTKDEYLADRIEYFSKEGGHVKTLALTGFVKHADKYWRPAKMRMINHQTKGETELAWSGYRFSTGLKGSELQPDNLKDLR
jgi:hypothetical protein